MIFELIFFLANCMMAVPDNFASHHYNFIPCDTQEMPSESMRILRHDSNPPPIVPPTAPYVPPPPPPIPPTAPYVPPPPPPAPYVPPYVPVTSKQTSDDNFNWNFLVLGLIVIFFGSIFVRIYSRRNRNNRRADLRNYDEVVSNTRISGNVRTDTDSVTKTENVSWGRDLFDSVKKNYPRDWAILKEFIVEQDDDRKDIVKRDEKLRQKAKEPLYKITDDKTCPICNTRFSSAGECARHVRDAHESYGV